jgi:hypothetical protein
LLAAAGPAVAAPIARIIPVTMAERPWRLREHAVVRNSQHTVRITGTSWVEVGRLRHRRESRTLLQLVALAVS